VDSIIWAPGANADAVVVSVEGELDIADAVTLREQLRIAAEAWPHVVVDLARTTFADSSCLGVLVAVSKRARTCGGSLRLVVEEGNLMRTLRISGLGGILSVYPTLDLAQSA
jgi:anti-sigma B factor antagonist